MKKNEARNVRHAIFMGSMVNYMGPGAATIYQHQLTRPQEQPTNPATEENLIESLAGTVGNLFSGLRNLLGFSSEHSPEEVNEQVVNQVAEDIQQQAVLNLVGINIDTGDFHLIQAQMSALYDPIRLLRLQRAMNLPEPTFWLGSFLPPAQSNVLLNQSREQSREEFFRHFAHILTTEDASIPRITNTETEIRPEIQPEIRAQAVEILNNLNAILENANAPVVQAVIANQLQEDTRPKNNPVRRTQHSTTIPRSHAMHTQKTKSTTPGFESIANLNPPKSIKAKESTQEEIKATYKLLEAVVNKLSKIQANFNNVEKNPENVLTNFKNNRIEFYRLAKVLIEQTKSHKSDPSFAKRTQDALLRLDDQIQPWIRAANALDNQLHGSHLEPQQAEIVEEEILQVANTQQSRQPNYVQMFMQQTSVPQLMSMLGVQQPSQPHPLSVWGKNEIQAAHQALINMASPEMKAILNMRSTDYVAVRMTNPAGEVITNLFNIQTLLEQPHLFTRLLNEVLSGQNVQVSVVPEEAVPMQLGLEHSQQPFALPATTPAAELSTQQILENMRMVALFDRLVAVSGADNYVPKITPQTPKMRIEHPMGEGGREHYEEDDAVVQKTATELSTSNDTIDDSKASEVSSVEFESPTIDYTPSRKRLDHGTAAQSKRSYDQKKAKQADQVSDSQPLSSENLTQGFKQTLRAQKQTPSVPANQSIEAQLARIEGLRKVMLSELSFLKTHPTEDSFIIFDKARAQVLLLEADIRNLMSNLDAQTGSDYEGRLENLMMVGTNQTLTSLGSEVVKLRVSHYNQLIASITQESSNIKASMTQLRGIKASIDQYLQSSQRHRSDFQPLLKAIDGHLKTLKTKEKLIKEAVKVTFQETLAEVAEQPRDVVMMNLIGMLANVPQHQQQTVNAAIQDALGHLTITDSTPSQEIVAVDAHQSALIAVSQLEAALIAQGIDEETRHRVVAVFQQLALLVQQATQPESEGLILVVPVENSVTGEMHFNISPVSNQSIQDLLYSLNDRLLNGQRGNFNFYVTTPNQAALLSALTIEAHQWALEQGLNALPKAQMMTLMNQVLALPSSTQPSARMIENLLNGVSGDGMLVTTASDVVARLEAHTTRQLQRFQNQLAQNTPLSLDGVESLVRGVVALNRALPTISQRVQMISMASSQELLLLGMQEPSGNPQLIANGLMAIEGVPAHLTAVPVMPIETIPPSVGATMTENEEDEVNEVAEVAIGPVDLSQTSKPVEKPVITPHSKTHTHSKKLPTSNQGAANMARNKKSSTTGRSTEEVDTSKFVQPQKSKKPITSSSPTRNTQVRDVLVSDVDIVIKQIREIKKNHYTREQLADLSMRLSALLERVSEASEADRLTPNEYHRMIVQLKNAEKILHEAAQPSVPLQSLDQVERSVKAMIETARNSEPTEGIKVLVQAQDLIEKFSKNNSMTAVQNLRAESTLIELRKAIKTAQGFLTSRLNFERKVQEKIHAHVTAAAKKVERLEPQEVLTGVVAQLSNGSSNEVAALLNVIVTPQLLDYLAPSEEQLQIGDDNQAVVPTQQQIQRRQQEAMELIQRGAQVAIANGANTQLVQRVTNALQVIAQLAQDTQNKATVLMIPYVTRDGRLVMNYIDLAAPNVNMVDRLTRLFTRMTLDGYQGNLFVRLGTQQQVATMQLALESLPQNGQRLSMQQVQQLLNGVMTHNLPVEGNVHRFAIEGSSTAVVSVAELRDAIAANGGALTSGQQRINFMDLMRGILIGMLALNQINQDPSLNQDQQWLLENGNIDVANIPAPNPTQMQLGTGGVMFGPELPPSNPVNNPPQNGDAKLTRQPKLDLPPRPTNGSKPLPREKLRVPQIDPLNLPDLKQPEVKPNMAARKSNQEMIDNYMVELAGLIIEIQALDQTKGLKKEDKVLLGQLAKALHIDMRRFLDKPSNDKFLTFKNQCEFSIKNAEKQFTKKDWIATLLYPILNAFLTVLNKINELIKGPKQHTMFKHVTDTWKESKLGDNFKQALQARMDNPNFADALEFEDQEEQKQNKPK